MAQLDPTNPFQQEVVGLDRQRQLAQMLIKQGMEQPQGQMVSGRFVAPAWTERLANLLNIYSGQRGLEEADKKQLDLAKQLREQQQKMGEQYFEAMSPTQTELAGPTPTGAPLSTVNQPDYRKAFTIATDPYAPSWLKAQAAEMLKPQKVGEGEKVVRFNPATGKNEIVAEGGEKYRAPVSIGNYLIDPVTRQVIFQAPEKPTAGQVIEREDGTFLVDTRTGQAKPVVGPQGQPLTGGKPLTETQANATAFGMRATEANQIVTDLEKKGFTNTGVVRTAVAGTMGQAPIVGDKLEQGVRAAFNVLPEVVGGPSPEQQQVDQARRNFISAVLRKESGAVIGANEYRDEERKYFPQAGDSDAVIKQKQDARILAIKALEAQAGPQGKKQIESSAGRSQLSPQDQEALNWANANPNDPRSAQIKQRLGR